MEELTAVVLDGLLYSSWLFIVAVGLTLIYGVMKILNIAHGSLYALGAYVAATAVGQYASVGGPPVVFFVLLVASAVVVGVVFGLIIERGVLRLMLGKDEVLTVIATYSVFLILEDLMKVVWGVDSYYAFQPYHYLGFVDIFGLLYQVYDLCFIVVALLLGAALWYWLNGTVRGKLVRAVMHDREMSEAFGINVTRTYVGVFVVGSILGALGGALTAPKIAVTAGLGVEVVVLAFAVAVIGGLGSIGGAMVGALIVGFSRSLSVHYFPQIELFAIYMVMAAVLAFRPRGLFAEQPSRKI